MKRQMVVMNYGKINNHLSRTKLLRQRRRPALQYELRQQQRMAMLVGGALSQAVNPAHLAGLVAYAVQRQSFLPQAFALTGALAHPHRASVSQSSGGGLFDQGLFGGVS